MDGEVKSYLRALTKKLKLEPDRSREIALELQSHLEDKIEELEEEGLAHAEALSQAIRELGQPDLVARGMYSVHSRGSWRDVLMGALPHFLLALLFALHLWTKFLLVAVLLVCVTCITLKGWKSGRPKWAYTWLGYSMAAPAISWVMALMAFGYGAWRYVATGDLPFSFPIYLLIIAYIPFSLWLMARVYTRIVRQDWLLASLTALPLPFLTSWMLFLNWRGGFWGAGTVGLRATDTDRALVFLVLALITGLFLRIGHRLVKIGLLTAATVLLVALTMAAIPLGLSLLSMILISLASVAFFFSPAVLRSRLDRNEHSHQPMEGRREVVTHWFRNAG